jgi:protein-disulfide isomerase-like protein with CxxC motif
MPNDALPPPAPIDVVHVTDPGCPWAYSAWPALATLQWRYGDQLAWTHVMIGLAEAASVYEGRGYTPARQAKWAIGFRRFGMPFATAPRERVSHTGLACRVVVAARLVAPEREIDVFRALQFGQFTTTNLFDTEDGVRASLSAVDGLDPDVILAALDDPATEAAYQADRAIARQAEGGATEFQGKAAQSDGPVRYTAPSLLMTHTPTAKTLEAGGFQTIEAYDVCVANLDVTLDRRAPAGSAIEALRAFPHALSTAEVAAIMAQPLAADTSTGAAEESLVDAVAAGEATRTPLGDDALWAVA